MKNTLLSSAILIALGIGSASAQDNLIFTPGEGDFNWQSLDEFAKAHDYSGQQLTIFGPWLGPDAEAAEAVFAYFAMATGADVRHTGSDSFEQQILVDLEAGSAPNLALFPQPGLVCDMAKRGFLTPLAKGTGDWMTENYAAGASWAALGTCDDANGVSGFYGFSYSASVKSLVWYSPENFEDAGYEVPQSMEELKALSDQIVEDGGTPWCVGLGSGSATGWPATDWVEDLMLRLESPEVYDQWVTNEIAFDDPRVVAVIEEFGTFVKNDDYVAGGAGTVATTDFRDSPKGLFSSPPQCYMHRQASFIPSFFPDDIAVGEDADFFYFPAYASKDLGNPVLGSATLFGMTNESEAAHGLIEFMKTPIAHEIWMAIEGMGFLTPLTSVNADVYASDSQRAQGDILLNASTFRFDGSDLMPGSIGTGAFWTGMVDFVGGKDAQTIAEGIQKAWSASK